MSVKLTLTVPEDSPPGFATRVTIQELSRLGDWETKHIELLGPGENYVTELRPNLHFVLDEFKLRATK